MGESGGLVRCAAERRTHPARRVRRGVPERPRGGARRHQRGAGPRGSSLQQRRCSGCSSTSHGCSGCGRGMHRRYASSGTRSGADSGGVLQLAADDTIAGVTAAHRQACATARAAVADLSLDDVVTGHRAGPRTLHWVYLQVLRELRTTAVMPTSCANRYWPAELPDQAYLSPVPDRRLWDAALRRCAVLSRPAPLHPRSCTADNGCAFNCDLRCTSSTTWGGRPLGWCRSPNRPGEGRRYGRGDHGP